MLKVLKFGGSSLASGETFEKVKKIVEADESRSIVIVSAPGKRHSKDMKVTDLLYLCQAHIKYNANFDHLYEEIKGRYQAIYDYCGLSQDLNSEFDAIREKLNKKTLEKNIL